MYLLKTYNTLSNSIISSNSLNNRSLISSNILNNLSEFMNNSLNDSDIYLNTLITNYFRFINIEKATITIGSTEEAVFFPIFAAAYTKNIISTVDAKNVLITWDATGLSTPLDLATGIAPV